MDPRLLSRPRCAVTMKGQRLLQDNQNTQVRLNLVIKQQMFYQGRTVTESVSVCPAVLPGFEPSHELVSPLQHTSYSTLAWPRLVRLFFLDKSCDVSIVC